MDFRNVAVMLVIFFIAAFYGAAMVGGIDLPDIDFGGAERARIEADALVRVAELEAQSRVDVAHTWADVLPVVLLIVGAIVLAAIVLHYRGKIALRMVERGPAPLPPLLPGQRAFAVELARLAADRGAEVEVEGGRYYLVKSGYRHEVCKLIPLGGHNG